MSIFSRLFSKSNKGTTNGYQCARCGKSLLPRIGGYPVVGGSVYVVAHECPNCGKIFCAACSIKADKELGRPKGAEDWTCPFCRTSGLD